MLTKLLTTGVTVEKIETNEEGIDILKTETAELTLREVLLDPDFMAEAKMSNELLTRYMTKDRALKIVEFLVDEPSFHDDAERYFQLPLIACECFTSDLIPMFTKHLFDPEEISANKMPIWDKIIGFFQSSPKKPLNVTLGGYINKVVSYWLLK